MYKVTAAVEQIVALAPSCPYTSTAPHSLIASHIYIVNYMARIIFTMTLASEIQNSRHCVFVSVIN